MEGDNDDSQREVEKGVMKAADRALAVHINEEFRPDARLHDVGDADHEKADDGELSNC
jgi:hypothetical protein